MFYIRFEKIQRANPPNSGIAILFTLINRGRRVATILSYECELWLPRNETATESEFVSRLHRDLRNDDIGNFQSQQEKEIALLWHFTPQQIQRIQDERSDGGVCLELRCRLMIASRWEGREAGSYPIEFGWETPPLASAGGGSIPVRIKIPQSDWISLLSDIDFKHVLLYELPLPDLQPEFSRSAEHLKLAWEHHNAKRPHDALVASFKVFECLGYNLYDEGMARSELFNRVMASEDQKKKEAVLKLCTAVQDYFHLGRHEREKPIRLSYADSEMALLFATGLLGYLSRLY